MNNSDVNLKENLIVNNLEKLEKKKKKKKKKNICSYDGCKKKLQIHEISIKCTNCNFSYCPKHRTKENHKCYNLNKDTNKRDYLNTEGLGGGKFTKIIKI